MRWWTSLPVGIPIGIIIGMALGAKAASGPSVILESMEHSDVSYRGGDITIKTTVQHKKDCPVVLRRWLGEIDKENPDEKPTVWRYIGESYAPPIPIGKNITFTSHVPISINVPKGNYQLETRGQDECTINPFQSPIRKTSFKIKINDPTENDPAPVAIPSGSSLAIKVKP